MHCPLFFFFFFFNDTATTEIYTLSLHDALPILSRRWRLFFVWRSWTHAVHVQAVKAPGAFKNGRRPPCRAACGVREASAPHQPHPARPRSAGRHFSRLSHTRSLPGATVRGVRSHAGGPKRRRRRELEHFRGDG